MNVDVVAGGAAGGGAVVRVLHATRGTVDAVLAGCPILPVEGLVCPNPACRGGYQIDESPFGEPVGWCPVCERGVVPPVLSGRIAVAADGAIIGTATATDVLPVTEALARFLPALGLSPGQWVVLLEADDEANLSHCPYYARFNSFPGHDPRATCSFGCRDEPECVTCEPEEGWPLVILPQPVPVAAAPVGTITTWEAE